DGRGILRVWARPGLHPATPLSCGNSSPQPSCFNVTARSVSPMMRVGAERLAMRLTQQTTYSIQTLIYCAVNRSGPARIRDVARSYRISELHLFKIMHVLVEHGLIETLRGRNGGIRLG